MSQLTQSDLLEQLRWRYAVKRFDPDRQLDNETWDTLENAMILAPSSYGLQPWRFIVITDQAINRSYPPSPGTRLNRGTARTWCFWRPDERWMQPTSIPTCNR